MGQKVTRRKKTKKKNSVYSGISLLNLAIVSLLFLVILRYGWLQVVKGHELTDKLNNQVKGESVYHVPRGAIYDCNMKELAVSTMVDSLFIDPNHLNVSADKVANELSPIIGLKPEEIKKKISEGGGFVWLKRQMPYEMAKQVKELIAKNEGYSAFLGFEKESKRFYPNDMLAANVIGFVGTDDKGLEGVEQQYDSLIKGEEKDYQRYHDAAYRPIKESVFQEDYRAKSDGKNIQLTINAQYQFIVEKALEKAMQTSKPHAITAIVMDPKTGEILAMASRPSFNPNKYYEAKEDYWRNRAITDIYEPGSVFKAVVAGAGFQEKLVKPTDIFVDPGVITVSGRQIHNWSGGSFGTVTFMDVVKNSINTGFAELGLKLGGERLMAYARKFGFGSPTGIDLPGEASGLLFNPKDMVDSDVATSAIGQSIAVTPLQMVRAMSAIANGGVLMKPHIVKAIYNADDTLYKKIEPEEVRRVLDPDVDKTLIGVLEQVVATGGGSKAKIQGYHIAGKTGTAQKIDPKHGGYMPGRYIASFCGFGPVENPQFTVLVVIDDPTQGAYYGGLIAAPVAHDIFLQLFRYANIKPTNGNQGLIDGLSKEVIHVESPKAEPGSTTVDKDGEDSDDEVTD